MQDTTYFDQFLIYWERAPELVGVILVGLLFIIVLLIIQMPTILKFIFKDLLEDGLAQFIKKGVIEELTSDVGKVNIITIVVLSIFIKMMAPNSIHDIIFAYIVSLMCIMAIICFILVYKVRDKN